MDHLRQGIGLRAYGQRDPKQAYKKEGYDGFMQMLGAINHQLMNQLMRVQGRAQAEEMAKQQRALQARARQYHESHGDAEGRPEKPAAKAPAKAGPKVGRNDPCPCGSGKKYKKCHGLQVA
jgi:preprotein translocase subunit SecA